MRSSIYRFLFVAAIVLLLAGMQQISGYRHLSLCSPFCRISVAENLAGEVFAAGLETKGTTQTAAAENADTKSQKIQLAHPEVPRIPAGELVHLLKEKADIVIVDTQAPDGYEMWHIPFAINITYDSTADPMNRQLMLTALPMDKQIVIYCLCEEGTDSAKMALELRRLGYSNENVKVLEGGLVLWDEKGYPMVKEPISK